MGKICTPPLRSVRRAKRRSVWPPHSLPFASVRAISIQEVRPHPLPAASISSSDAAPQKLYSAVGIRRPAAQPHSEAQQRLRCPITLQQRRRPIPQQGRRRPIPSSAAAMDQASAMEDGADREAMDVVWR